jgi:predicted PurR-regulated permease PerM
MRLDSSERNVREGVSGTTRAEPAIPVSRSDPPGLKRPDLPAPAGTSAIATLSVIVIIIAALYFGREIFVPLALAMLLSFALAPPVRWLRLVYFPRLPAVLTVVTVAFLVIVAFGWVVMWQVVDLAQQLPSYQRNIEAKIDDFREGPPGARLFGRAAEMVRDLGRKIEQEAEEQEAQAEAEESAEAAASGTPQAAEPEPIPIEIHEPEPTAMEVLRSIVGPLIAPLATAGIVIVFVIFMLLKREDLRDRLIRLAGPRDLPRTTQALDDAARRVGHYLLMQLVVNTTYGIPIGVGLWLIGVPNPILWGMIAIVLRFVPYIGPVIAAFFPLALAVAVDPGWQTLLWTGALFIIIELISNNAVEPWLYGSSTGLSPVAIIAAAIFWTWLWGPIGLLLSTPLTVCLVVLGRHVPQLAFLDVLFGNEPVLTPAESLYQRLLVGDHDEATERAEEYLREHPLEEFYEEVGIAALALAEHDRLRGALDEELRVQVAESALLLTDNLAEFEEIATPAEQGRTPAQPAHERDEEARLPRVPRDRLVVCAGARGNLDDAAAAMLGQVLEGNGVNVRLLPFQSLQSARLKELELDDVAVIVLSYLNSDSLAHARLLARRIRRRFPEAKLVIALWTFAPEDIARRDPVAATGADRVSTSLRDAVADILAQLSPEQAQTDAVESAQSPAPPVFARETAA